MMPAIRVRRGAPSMWESPFDLFRQEFDRFFNDQGEATTATYPVDVREDNDHFYVDAELPGFTKDQIDVSLENGVLTITAERKDEPQEGKDKAQTHLRERRFTRISRSFSLPNTVDPNKVDAKLKDGVLHLTITKREEVKPRRITVS